MRFNLANAQQFVCMQNDMSGLFFVRIIFTMHFMRHMLSPN